MVDIDEDGVEGPRRRIRIEAGNRCGEREEIAEDQPAARIAGQPGSERQQSAGVPVDHRFQRLDDDERTRPPPISSTAAAV